MMKTTMMMMMQRPGVRAALGHSVVVGSGECFTMVGC